MNHEPATLLKVIEQQKDIITKLEVKLVRAHDHIMQVKNNHSEVNSKLIQANVSYQQAITEANRSIKTLRQEKDHLQTQLGEARAEAITTNALNCALQAENKIFREQNQTILNGINSKLSQLIETNYVQKLNQPVREDVSTFLLPDVIQEVIVEQKPKKIILSTSPPRDSIISRSRLPANSFIEVKKQQNGRPFRKTLVKEFSNLNASAVSSDTNNYPTEKKLEDVSLDIVEKKKQTQFAKKNRKETPHDKEAIAENQEDNKSMSENVAATTFANLTELALCNKENNGFEEDSPRESKTEPIMLPSFVVDCDDDTDEQILMELSFDLSTTEKIAFCSTPEKTVKKPRVKPVKAQQKSALLELNPSERTRRSGRGNSDKNYTEPSLRNKLRRA